jgi:hypothetical protein
MNDKDLQKYIRSLVSLDANLPRHQQKLKRQLLGIHTPQQTLSDRFMGAFILLTAGDIRMKKNINKTIGVSALVVSIFAVGILAIGTMHPQPVAAQLLTEATKRTQQMSPAEIEKINNQYRQDIRQRLSEAKKANSLQVLSYDQAAKWIVVAKADPTTKTYLGYTDAQNHRILIGLDENKEPLFIYDVDKPVQNTNTNDPSNSTAQPPQPTVEVKQ